MKVFSDWKSMIAPIHHIRPLVSLKMPSDMFDHQVLTLNEDFALTWL